MSSKIRFTPYDKHRKIYIRAKESFSYAFEITAIGETTRSWVEDTYDGDQVIYPFSKFEQVSLAEYKLDKWVLLHRARIGQLVAASAPSKVVAKVAALLEYSPMPGDEK